MKMKEKYEIIKNIIKIHHLYDDFCDISTLKEENFIFKVYENDKLGIYSCDVQIPDEKGFELAGKNLSIYCPYSPAANVQMNVITKVKKRTVRQLNEMVCDVANAVKKTDPDTDIFYTYERASHNMTNDLSLHLNYEYVTHRFSIRTKDMTFSMHYLTFDEEKVKNDILPMIRAIKAGEPNKSCDDSVVDFSKYTYFVLPSDNKQIFDYFENLLEYSNVMQNNLIYKELFPKNFSLYTSLNYEDKRCRKYGNTAFFDFEGSYNQYYRKYLIRDGVVLQPYTDKKTSKDSDTENTACCYFDGSTVSCKLLGACIDMPLYDFTLDDCVLIQSCDISWEDDFVNIQSQLAFSREKDGSLTMLKPFSIKIPKDRLFTENFIGTTGLYRLAGETANGLVFKL